MQQTPILPALDQWLANVFDPENLDATCDALAAASRPDPRDGVQRRDLTHRLTECDRRLDRYREALAGNGDATEIAIWIAETQRERDQLRYELAAQTPNTEITRDEARDLVESVEDLTTVIAEERAVLIADGPQCERTLRRRQRERCDPPADLGRRARRA